MSPLTLTDSQFDTLCRCAGTLVPAARPAFLELVIGGLDGGEIGDGSVARAVRTALETLGALPSALAAGVPGHGGKYR